jgi:hypothetical protein
MSTYIKYFTWLGSEFSKIMLQQFCIYYFSYQSKYINLNNTSKMLFLAFILLINFNYVKLSCSNILNIIIKFYFFIVFPYLKLNGMKI